jgi:hypothetical protein
MNKTGKAFRLIVLRRPREQDLFEDKGPYRYHAVASNRADDDSAATTDWYSERGDASENRIEDLKIGFGMEYMPCGAFQGNAVFFIHRRYDLQSVFGVARRRAVQWMGARVQVQTARWRLFRTAGKIVRHGRQTFLTISAAMLAVLPRSASVTRASFRRASCRKEGSFQRRRDREDEPLMSELRSRYWENASVRPLNRHRRHEAGAGDDYEP